MQLANLIAVLSVYIATAAENIAPVKQSVLHPMKTLTRMVAVQAESRPSSQQTVTSVLAQRGFNDVLYTFDE